MPIVFDYNGIVRILDALMSFKEKTLLTLYYKRPEDITETQLLSWLKHSNPSTYRKSVLGALDKDNLILRETGKCVITPTGIRYVEKNIPLDIDV